MVIMSASACWPNIFHLWSYVNTIETAVLLAVVYDVVFHQLNTAREKKREEEAEERTIQREDAAERRQIERERQELIRQHWQELQTNLVTLHRSAARVQRSTQFIRENADSQNATTRFSLQLIATGLPQVLAEFDEGWGRVVAQLNVFPPPRDALALEILDAIQQLGKAVGDKQKEITDETLKALAEFVPRVADKGTLPGG